MIHAIELENFKGVSGDPGKNVEEEESEGSVPGRGSGRPPGPGPRPPGPGPRPGVGVERPGAGGRPWAQGPEPATPSPGRIRLELAPVTLLFGANNAGKSSILQSLLYMLEVLEHGRADVDRTELGGDVVDLGGFHRVVHRHEPSRTVVVRVEFDTPGSLNVLRRAPISFTEDLDDHVEAAWVDIRVRAVDGFVPMVERVVTGIAGDATPLLEIYTHDHGLPREGSPLLATFNLQHATLAPFEDSLLAELGQGAFFAEPGQLTIAFSRSERLSAVPPLDEPIRVLSYEEEPSARDLATLLIEMLGLGVIRQLVGALREALYIGPLRVIPPRGFLHERVERSSRWGDGLAAWDALLSEQPRLLDATNTWLERLGVGCQVRVQRLDDARAPADMIGSSEATVRRLLLEIGHAGDVLPCEVGAGISQVIPIVVAAVDHGRRKVALIEQPELHIHPALQVGLGDLFIEASKTRQFLIETHSEHLVLRLLRRIRQTTDGELDGAPAFAPDRLSILYVENSVEGVAVRKLRVDATGEFVDRWPKGFFEERGAELF